MLLVMIQAPKLMESRSSGMFSGLPEDSHNLKSTTCTAVTNHLRSMTLW